MLEGLIFILDRTLQPIITVKVHHDTALIEAVVTFGKIGLHDETEILLSCLHLQHRSVVVSEMVICPLP